MKTMALLPAVSNALIASILVISAVKADCDSPPSIQNAINNLTGTPPYSDNITVRYDCKIGFNPTGSHFYTCNNAVWNGGDFRCEQIFCPYVKIPENGQILNTPTNEVGTSIKFACNEGHDMSGFDMLICRSDGKWSPSTPPTCIAKDCGEFGSIQYADTFQDNSEIERNLYGSVVEVTCQNGRVLNGPPRIKCEADGQWSDRPTCNIMECPQYPNTNSSCISKTELQGNFYFTICKDKISTKTGPDAAECVSGTWDSLEMACFCDCTIPDYNKNLIRLDNLNKHDNLPHNTTLQWVCTRGMSSSSIGYVICKDGQLKAVKDGNEVTAANGSNTSDINRMILSELCYHPTTIAAATTEMTSSIPTSTTARKNQDTDTTTDRTSPKDRDKDSTISVTDITTDKISPTDRDKGSATDQNNRSSATAVFTNVLSIFIVCLLSIF